MDIHQHKYYVRVCKRTNTVICSVFQYLVENDDAYPISKSNFWYDHLIIYIPDNIPFDQRRRYCELQLLITNP